MPDINRNVRVVLGAPCLRPVQTWGFVRSGISGVQPFSLFTLSSAAAPPSVGFGCPMFALFANVGFFPFLAFPAFSLSPFSAVTTTGDVKKQLKSAVFAYL
jgi:hypothetical protein